jgi:hypothetical protein
MTSTGFFSTKKAGGGSQRRENPRAGAQYRALA